jgi:peptide/nickel transport system substrate-binding protein
MSAWTKKSLLSLVAVASVAVIASACSATANPSGSTSTSSTASAGTPRYGGSLTVRQIQDVTSLDPILGNSGYDQQTLYPFYDRLVNLDPSNLEPLPGLATKWYYPNPTTLVLDLRSGVQFQDGTPFNAAAVAYNLNRARTLKTSTVLQDLSSIKDVTAVSNLVVRIDLTQPDSALPIILSDRAGMMASPKAIQAGNLAKDPVGTGPYEFVRWIPGNELVGKKNPHYWQPGKPYLNQITFKFITPPETARDALVNGQVDVALNMEPSDVSALQSDTNLVVSVHPSLFIDQCYLNFSKPPFNNADVRMAANLAINRPALTQALTFGYGQPAEQMFPKGYWAYQPDLANAFPYDPAKSEQLLKQAGYGSGVTITGVTTTDPAFARLNELVQAYFAKVGIKMTFVQQPPVTATVNFFNNLTPDIYCSAWSGRPDATQTLSSLFASDSYFNAGKYAAPGMAAALAASEIGDPNQRAVAINQVGEIAEQQALNIPVAFIPNIDAYSKNVGGYAPSLGKADVSFLWLKS